MTKKAILDTEQFRLIDSLVRHFVKNKELFEMALNTMHGYVTISKGLKPYIHTIKARIKDPEHLKDKLIRKATEAKKAGAPFNITKENLFTVINDLVGLRIIHLHTRQIEQINTQLKRILKLQQLQVIDGPTARTWDDEFRAYFESIGIKTLPNPNMYTSVHYIIKYNPRITCEIQVRTLMEEVWGEVDHSINYPHKSTSLPVREQIKTLARVTSGCSRLVDSIFSSHNVRVSRKKKKKK